jgi:hypothetical protein
LLTLGFNGLPNIVTDQAPQGHLILGTGNFIDTHLQLLFFYLSEKTECIDLSSLKRRGLSLRFQPQAQSRY